MKKKGYYVVPRVKKEKVNRKRYREENRTQNGDASSHEGKGDRSQMVDFEKETLRWWLLPTL